MQTDILAGKSGNVYTNLWKSHDLSKASIDVTLLAEGVV